MMTSLEVVMIKCSFFFFDFTLGLVKLVPESLKFMLELRNFAATLLASSTKMTSIKNGRHTIDDDSIFTSKLLKFF